MVLVRSVKKKAKEGFRYMGLGVFFIIGFLLFFFIRDSFFENIEKQDDSILHSMLLPREEGQDKYIHPDTQKALELRLKNEELENMYEGAVMSLNDSVDKIERLKSLASRGGVDVPIVDYNKIPHRPQYIVDVMQRLWVRMGGTHTYVPYCIIAYESNFDTFTRNTNGENSFGLLQVNVGHPSHSARVGGSTNYHKLYEPVFNMTYQFPELIRYEKEGIAKGLSGADLTCYVARYGQRPAWKDWIRQAINKSHQEFMNAIIE